MLETTYDYALEKREKEELEADRKNTRRLLGLRVKG
jgi:hypothetical protein